MSEDKLASFIDDVCGEGHLRVEADLGGGFVRLRSSEAERRQAAQDIRCSEDIVIEMLRNSRDAHASNIFVAVTREGARRRIVIIDDGDGIPEHMCQLVFDPRVTSKLDTMHMDKWGVHGRGMALYSIAVNAESARVAASLLGQGSALVVDTDLSKLPEKTDQSTFPTFDLSESGTVMVRGPKNILRTTCEFAIEARKQVNVFIGSATDVAATLYAYGLSQLTTEHRLPGLDVGQLPVCVRLAVAHDPGQFARIAEKLGLVMSDRSARRIMDGQIAPLPPLLSRINVRGVDAQAPTSEVDERMRRKPPRERSLKVSDGDAERFSEAIGQAFGQLARDYYLEEVKPQIRFGKDVVRITIPLVRQR